MKPSTSTNTPASPVDTAVKRRPNKRDPIQAYGSVWWVADMAELTEDEVRRGIAAGKIRVLRDRKSVSLADAETFAFELVSANQGGQS